MTTQSENDVWKLIWSLNVQSKVQNFLWRSCHNAIPVKQNLKQRHILNEDVCNLCKLETELVVHALWGCSQLTLVWGSIPSFSFCQTRAFSSIKRCSLMHTKNRKIWNCWHQLCGHSSIAETKSKHPPRNIRCRRWPQQRFKHWMTS